MGRKVAVVGASMTLEARTPGPYSGECPVDGCGGAGTGRREWAAR